MRKRTFSLILFTAVLLSASDTWAQDAITAVGKITDPSGKAVVASIKYKSIPTGSLFGSFKDSVYSFTMFGSAKYQVSVNAEGFVPNTFIIDPKTQVNGRLTRDVRLMAKGNTIRLDNLIFDQGKAKIDPTSYPQLDELVALMDDHKSMVIQLEGHTDNQGNSKANMKLSEERVEAVKRYLTSRGVSKGRIKTKAFGGTQPLANEMTPEARAMNRRVEVRILKD